MGFYGVAGAKFVRRTDDFAVFGQKAITLPIDALGIASLQSLLKHFHFVPANKYLSFGCPLEPDQ